MKSLGSSSEAVADTKMTETYLYGFVLPHGSRTERYFVALLRRPSSCVAADVTTSWEIPCHIKATTQPVLLALDDHQPIFHPRPFSTPIIVSVGASGLRPLPSIWRNVR